MTLRFWWPRIETSGEHGPNKTSDVVDAVVVTTALRQKAAILTSDPEDIERLVRASGREAAVVAI
jgi:hypothetical protein